MIGLVADAVTAHGFSAGSSAWSHPLTGWDHVIAMVAVGAWSAQLGKRALWAVPGGFLVAMTLGASVGAAGIDAAGVEVGIACSVVALGLALATRVRTASGVAAASVALFGLCHGLAHGQELAGNDWDAAQLAGVLGTTAALHVVGMAAGLLSLESRGKGRSLRWAGWAAAGAGVGLLLHGL